MLSLQIRLILAAGIFVAGLGTGWVVNGWRNDAIQLAADSAAATMADLHRTEIATIAKHLEDKIASNVATERIIERGVIKEIRNNEIVYRNVCITDAGRVHINDAAKGRVSSKPAKEVP